MSSDIKGLWQNLKTEETMMSVEDVQLKAVQSLRKTRRDGIARLAFAVAATAFCIVALASTRVNSFRYIAAIVMAGVLANAIRSVYVSWKDKGASSPAASWTSCAQFYRHELVRQQVFCAIPVWQMVAALAVIAWLAPRAFRRINEDLMGVVFSAVLLGAAGMIVLIAVRKFQARHVETDLEALKRFEQDNDLGG